MTVEVKVLEANTAALAQQYGSLDHISHLADISRPGVRLQGLDTVLVKLDLTASQVGGDFIDEVLGHDWDILNSFTKRWKGKRDGANPKIKIVPEQLLTHKLTNILVRGGD